MPMATTPQEAARSLRARDAARGEELAGLRTRSLAVLRSACRPLLEERAAPEVILYGSLAWGTLRPASDVDLAVRGQSSADYPLWASRLEEALEALELPLEIVRFEDLGEGLQQKILKRGVRL